MESVFGILRRILPMDRRRRAMMEDHGWYRNMVGTWVHPHCMDWMTPSQIKGLTVPQLEYKLRYGSMSPLPENLRKGRA